MNTRLKTICILLLLAHASFAQGPVARPGQPIGGIVVKGGRNPGGSMLLSLSGGVTNPGRATKDDANINNGTAFEGGLYVPLIAKGNLTFGLNAGGEYFSSNKDYNSYESYPIGGQTGAPEVSAKGAGSPKSQGFKTELGPQINFSIGKLTISPVLNASYMSVKQEAFTITQTSSVNGKSYNYNLYSQAETKTKGFALIPKLRFAYFPGKIGLYAEGNYTAGPTVKNETTTFSPNGAITEKGYYNFDQMLAGTNRTQTKSTSYSSFGINIGISFALGKTVADQPANGRKSRHETAKNSISNIRMTEAPDPSNPTVNPVESQNAMRGNPLYTGNSSTASNPMYEGFVAGNPIGGIIVKGGKNPGGAFRSMTTNDKGEFELKGIEAGDYKFSLTASSAAQRKAKKQAKQAKKDNKEANAVQGNPLYEGSGNAGVNPLFEGIIAGSPIGGIIVKGGKNPGGNLMTVTSNEKGEFELKGLEAGDYLFTVTAPEPSGKGKLKGKVTKPGDNGM